MGLIKTKTTPLQREARRRRRARTAGYLREVENLTYREIGERMGCSITQAQQCYFRFLRLKRDARGTRP